MSESRYGNLDPLFNAELRYLDGMPPVCELLEGCQLVGSGTGHLEGQRVSGTLRRSNLEQVFEDHCRLNVTVIIETVDGAEILFDSQGFAIPHAGDETWRVASAVRFAASDVRYRESEAGPAVWQGEFDATTATAGYRAHLSAGPNPDDIY